MKTKIYGVAKNKESQKQLIEECADLLEILLEFKPVRKPEDFWDD